MNALVVFIGKLLFRVFQTDDQQIRKKVDQRVLLFALQ
jgi:hypothetical protein